MVGESPLLMFAELLRSVLRSLIVLCLFLPARGLEAETFVLCDPANGTITLDQVDGEPSPLIVISGPFTGRRSAALWVVENCAAERCDGEGRCLESEPEADDGATGDGWVVGELSSVTLGESSNGVPAAQVPAPGVRGPTGPGTADLGPLINTAVGAAGACNYHAALATADHLTNFDPHHPWLAANYATLRRLYERQRVTQDRVWQASSALSEGRLDQARDLAASAANSSVSCQASAVSQLLEGIETAMRQKREERNMRNSQAAAALLPGLVNLARVIGGGQPTTSVPTTVQDPQIVSTLIPGAADPCEFTFVYRDLASLEPACTCPGYVFAPNRFRCVAASR